MKQLDLFHQVRQPVRRKTSCPGEFMCPGSCGFALWGDPLKRLQCMVCDQTKLRRPDSAEQ